MHGLEIFGTLVLLYEFFLKSCFGKNNMYTREEASIPLKTKNTTRAVLNDYRLEERCHTWVVKI